MVEIGIFAGNVYTALQYIAVFDAMGDRAIISRGESFKIEDLMPPRLWHNSEVNYYWITGGRCMSDDNIISLLSGNHMIYNGNLNSEPEFEGSISRLALVE